MAAPAAVGALAPAASCPRALRLLPGWGRCVLFGLVPRPEHHVLSVVYVIVRSDVVVWSPQVLRVFFPAKHPLDLVMSEFRQHQDGGDGDGRL
jgi:hypothetical protein